MKVCNICRIEKNTDAFYNDSKSKDGKKGYCKECDKNVIQKRAAEKRRAKAAEKNIGAACELVTERACTLCGEVKPLSEFFRDKTRKYGVIGRCKPCDTKARGYKTKEEREAERKAKKLEAQLRSESTCQCCGETKSIGEFYKGNNAKCKECQKKATAEWKRNNKEKAKQHREKWNAKNTEYIKARQKAHDLRRRAQKKSLPKTLTIRETSELLARGCALTGAKDDVHLDHFIPLAWGYGGTTYENMIPLASELNLSKSDRNPFDWIKTQQGVDMDKWNELVRYLAELNDMTAQEYEEYVYYCESNKRDLTKQGA